MGELVSPGGSMDSCTLCTLCNVLERESPRELEKNIFFFLSAKSKNIFCWRPRDSLAPRSVQTLQGLQGLLPPHPCPPLVGQVAPAGNRAALLGPLLLRLEYS